MALLYAGCQLVEHSTSRTPRYEVSLASRLPAIHVCRKCCRVDEWCVACCVLLKTKSNPFYLKDQFVPRGKHLLPRLCKPIVECSIGKASIFFSEMHSKYMNTFWAECRISRFSQKFENRRHRELQKVASLRQGFGNETLKPWRNPKYRVIEKDGRDLEPL